MKKNSTTSNNTPQPSSTEKSLKLLDQDLADWCFTEGSKEESSDITTISPALESLILAIPDKELTPSSVGHRFLESDQRFGTDEIDVSNTRTFRQQVLDCEEEESRAASDSHTDVVYTPVPSLSLLSQHDSNPTKLKLGFHKENRPTEPTVEEKFSMTDYISTKHFPDEEPDVWEEQESLSLQTTRGQGRKVLVVALALMTSLVLVVSVVVGLPWSKEKKPAKPSLHSGAEHSADSRLQAANNPPKQKAYPPKHQAGPSKPAGVLLNAGSSNSSPEDFVFNDPGPDSEEEVTSCVRWEKRLGLGRPRIAGARKFPAVPRPLRELRLFKHLVPRLNHAVQANIRRFVELYQKDEPIYRCRGRSYLYSGYRLRRCRRGARYATKELIDTFDKPKLYNKFKPVEKCLFNRLLIRAYLWLPYLYGVELVMDRSIPETKHYFDEDLQELKRRHKGVCFRMYRSFSGTLSIKLRSKLLNRTLLRSRFRQTAWPITLKKKKVFCTRLMASITGLDLRFKVPYNGRFFVEITNDKGETRTETLKSFNIDVGMSSRNMQIYKISKSDFERFDRKINPPPPKKPRPYCKPGFVWMDLTINSGPICVQKRPYLYKTTIQQAERLCRRRGFSLMTEQLLARAHKQQLVTIHPRGEWAISREIMQDNRSQGHTYVERPFAQRRGRKRKFLRKTVYGRKPYILTYYKWLNGKRVRHKRKLQVFPVFRCYHRPIDRSSNP